MLTLLSTIAGFLAPVVAKGVDTYREGKNHQHALDRERLNNELTVQLKDKDVALTRELKSMGLDLEQQQIALKQMSLSVEEGINLRAHDQVIASAENVPAWVHAMRASVRPFITYWFMFLFTLVEITTLCYLLFATDMQLPQILKEVWDAETEALFAAIVAFWFGSRALTSK